MSKEIPNKVQQKAGVVLTRYRQGLVNPRKTRCHGYYVLDVGLDWRLLSKDGGKSFELMSHETYNKQVDRRSSKLDKRGQRNGKIHCKTTSS